MAARTHLRVIVTVLSFSARLAIAQTPASTDSAPALDAMHLMGALSALAADSMEGRRAGTPGGERARAFLEREFTRIGLRPAGRGFDVPFTARSHFADRAPLYQPPCTTQGVARSQRPCQPPRPTYPLVHGVNLVGLVRGTAHPDRYLVVSAHYDHLGMVADRIYHGADDNASGAAAILAIAAWSVAHPPRNSILFVWFDAEESGLLGSTAFVGEPPVPLPSIVADVNVDMIGSSMSGELYAAGAARYPMMQPFVDSTRALGLVTLLQGHDGGAPMNDWTHRSDMGPFHDRGIPFLDFGTEENGDYHQPSDIVERIQPEFYRRSALTIAEFVRLLDRGLDVVAAARATRE